ncbi:MAG: hypothetical protein Q9190_007502 [Brigantiaea leucoxantha]
MLLEAGPVIVVGGCGFLGKHITAQLAMHQKIQLWVLDLEATHGRIPNVNYCNIDITSRSAVCEAFHKIKPLTIFHTAAPNVLAEHPNFATRKAHYEKVNISGTRNLIECAGEVESVKVFVYTSSASVVHDSVNDLFDADERLPILQTPQQKEIYSHTKGVAESLVLSANRRYNDMLTLAIRPVSMFGEGDPGWIPNLLDVYKKGNTKVQLGDNTALIDYLYVGNSAYAHIQAAEKLHRTQTGRLPGGPIDGEAFFVTNDEPYRFWDFARAFWRAAGDRSNQSKVFVIPKGLGLILATLAEWIFWILFLGTKEPKLSRRRIKHTCMNRTFCIDKAKTKLEYRPQIDMQSAIDKSVKWFQEQSSTTAGGKKDA